MFGDLFSEAIKKNLNPIQVCAGGEDDGVRCVHESVYDINVLC